MTPPAYDDHRDRTAERVLHDRLAELVERLALQESRIRHQEAGGIHRMRVALRSLRSLLVTFGPLFDPDQIAALRAELQWISGELAGARDAEVVRKRLHALATTGEERAVVHRVDEQLGSAEAAALVAAVTAFDSPRYEQLHQDLSGFVAQAPGRFAAGDVTEGTLRGLVHEDWKRLRRRAQRARGVIEPALRQEALHDVRKAAKRLRYSAEVLTPLSGASARRLARDAEQVQTALGDLQDSVIARAALRELAADDRWSAQEQFTLGGLHAREQRISARTEDRYARAWTRLARKKNRQWLV